MKDKIQLLFAIFLVFFLVSCGEKTDKEPVLEEKTTQAVMSPDTSQQIPEVVKEVIEEPVSKEKTITVQKGEWLYDIARKEYGSMHEWRKIYEANKDKISDPNLIYPNQQLVLPE